MKNRKIILTVGCALALMLAPATVYADTAAQTSPRLGIPVVGSNGEAYANVAISRDRAQHQQRYRWKDL